jgi:hypothetical protein
MFEPQFYLEVRIMPRRRIISYFLLLLVFFSAIISGAKTYYLIDAKRGVPRMLAAAFPGMAIENGILHPTDSQPYVPPSYLITPIFNQLFSLPAMINNEADSLVIVDTTTNARIPSRIPVILLKADKMIVVLNKKRTMEFSYENIMFGKKDLFFTVENIEQFLKSHIWGFFIGYYVSTLMHQGVLIFFSIFFLAFAAYIFRVDRKRSLKENVKTASFAISPIAVGSALIAISGVKVEWTWHILIFLSTIIMFRAIIAMSNAKRKVGEI